MAFNLYSNYYDALYSDKDYIEEAAYIVKKLSNNGVSTGNILEFGCGTGIHGRLLGNSGYSVHGIDQSRQMIEIAKTSTSFTCQIGDIRTVELGKKFNGIISLFHVMSYQTENSDVNAVLSNANKHLDVGGTFIFDFWYLPAVLSQKPECRIKKMENGNASIIRFAQPEIHYNSNLVDVNYTILIKDLKTNESEEIFERHSMRYFTLPEISLFCEVNGFRIKQAEEFLSSQAPSEETWGICVVLEKV